MNVYVESNFVLALVLEQEESPACEELLALAERREVRLVVPMFALIEPQWAVNRRASERRELGRLVETTHQQLRRNTRLGPESQRLSGELDRLLTSYEQQEEVLVRSIRDRLLAHADVLPADGPLLREAERVAKTHDLGYFDAIMFASVLLDLAKHRAGPNIFINKNTKDFAVDSVRQALRDGNCKFVSNFSNGRAFVCATLLSPTSSSTGG